MAKVTLGRVERVVLSDRDYVQVHDALGNTLDLTPIVARQLHRELGKFLSMANDAKPVPTINRGDFRALQNRVAAIEKLLTEEEA